MDAKELRGRLKGWSLDDNKIRHLTKDGAEHPFYYWWYSEYLSQKERDAIGGRFEYLTDAMVAMCDDEELMFLWAVYCM